MTQGARRLTSLDDDAARAEALRLSRVALARWRQHAEWMGFEVPGEHAEQERPHMFESGMLALFRYARGEDVPEMVVEDFLDQLLNLLFAGLASGALALPRFRKMEQRPWALAWRLASARLMISSEQPVDLTELAHILDVGARELVAELESRSVPLLPGLRVSASVAHTLLGERLPELGSE